MTKIYCPTCSNPIPSSEVNIQANIAKCHHCGGIFKASDLLKKEPEPYRHNLYPPHGSKIEIFENEAGNVELRLPPKGFSGSIAYITFFGVAWLSFITFWTYMAITMVPFPGNIAFSLFSIPFWFIGFMMAYGVINALREYQIVEVQDHQFILRKVRPINSKSQEIPFTRIDKIDLVKMDEKKSFSMMDKVNTTYSKRANEPQEMPNVPTFQMGIKKINFFEYVEPEEATWLMQTLNDLMAERQRA